MVVSYGHLDHGDMYNIVFCSGAKSGKNDYFAVGYFIPDSLDADYLV